jgi:hypothetical protein
MRAVQARAARNGLKIEMPLVVTTRQGAFPYLFCFTTTTKGVYMRERFRQFYTVPICVKPSERGFLRFPAASCEQSGI